MCKRGPQKKRGENQTRKVKRNEEPSEKMSSEGEGRETRDAKTQEGPS